MKREIQNKLSRRDSFGVEGFDYRLLPLFLPSVGEKTLIVFEDSLNGVHASKSGGFLTYGVGNIEIIDYVDLFITNFLDFKLNDINS